MVGNTIHHFVRGSVFIVAHDFKPGDEVTVQELWMQQWKMSANNWRAITAGDM